MFKFVPRIQYFNLRIDLEGLASSCPNRVARRVRVLKHSVSHPVWTLQDFPLKMFLFVLKIQYVNSRIDVEGLCQLFELMKDLEGLASSCPDQVARSVRVPKKSASHPVWTLQDFPLKMFLFVPKIQYVKSRIDVEGMCRLFLIDERP